jgi:hypothetical protein
MISKLNYDVAQYMVKFINKNEIIFISETCKFFNCLIKKNQKPFPKESFIFSKIKYIDWAIEHDYKIKKSKMFINAIKYGNVKIIQYLNDNILNSSKYFNSKLYVHAIRKRDIEFLKWLVKYKCLYDISVLNESLSSPLYIHNWIVENLIWNQDQFFNVIKKDDVLSIKWVTSSLPHLTVEFSRTGHL